MTFKDLMKRKLRNSKSKEKPEIIIKEKEVAKVIIGRLKTAVKKYNRNVKHEWIYVAIQTEFVKESLLVTIDLSFTSNFRDYIESFYVECNREEFTYKDEKDPYYKGGIVDELEIILEKEGFTNICTDKSSGWLETDLDLR